MTSTTAESIPFVPDESGRKGWRAVATNGSPCCEAVIAKKDIMGNREMADRLVSDAARFMGVDDTSQVVCGNPRIDDEVVKVRFWLSGTVAVKIEN